MGNEIKSCSHSKSFLIKEFLKHDFEKIIYNLKSFNNKNGTNWLSKVNTSPPNSTRIKELLIRSDTLMSPVVKNHSLRSYLFGKVISFLDEQDVDEEVFFAGTYLHDLGLERECINTTFELVGANEAVRICSESFSEKEKEQIHEMIVLHDAIGTALSKSNELKYLHIGAGTDVAGLWSYRLNEKTMKSVYEEHPSLNHIEIMINLLKMRLKENPKMFLSQMINLGFLGKMKKYENSVKKY